MAWFYLEHWLTEPTPGVRLSLSAKKTILIILSFCILMCLGILEYILIERFSVLLPRLVHATVFLLELIFFLLFTYAIYPEKARLTLPFLISQVVRLFLLLVVIIFHVISLATSSDSPAYGEATRSSLMLLTVPVSGHLILGYVALCVYQVCSSGRTATSGPIRSNRSPRGHHVIVVDDRIEQSVFSPKSLSS